MKEGVTGVDISYQDNQPVLELFLSRPMGLISLLDEQCRTNVRKKYGLDAFLSTRQCNYSCCGFVLMALCYMLFLNTWAVFEYLI